MNSLLQRGRQYRINFLLLSKVFPVSTTLFEQKEDRIYKKQDPVVEGRKLNVSFIITGSTKMFTRSKYGPNGDFQFNYVLDNML